MEQGILKYFGYIIGFFFVGIQLSCANYGNLTGGPKDTTPPRLIEEASTPFNQLRFRPKQINLTFDEWIKLKDQYKQILISPPLNKRVNYTVKGKTLNIKFDEEEIFMDSSTYVIQFGSSILDITENNPISNLKFVFSTGDVIDSLEIEGQVIDAWTKKPVENATVMLYNDLVDSLPYTIKPNYVVRTNSKGRFVLQNLRKDSFKIFVLEDQNINYLYDLDHERIAFQQAPVLSLDTMQDLKLWMFEKAIPNEVAGKTIWYNALRFYFEKAPDNVRYHFMDTIKSFHTWHGDSLYIWLDQKIEQDNQLFLMDEREMLDTIDISYNKIRNTHKSRLRIFNDLTLQKRKQKAWSLHTNQPLQIIKDSIILMDSIKISSDSFQLKRDTNPELWYLYYPWDKKLSYKIVILPGGMIGPNKNSNVDSIFVDLRINKQEGLGNIIVHITKADTAAEHLILRLEKGEDLVLKQSIEARDSVTIINLYDLPPADYQLRIIYDINNNGRWDAGDYDKNIQPEELQIESLQALRANWDLDVTIKIGNQLNDEQDDADNENNE